MLFLSGRTYFVCAGSSSVMQVIKQKLNHKEKMAGIVLVCCLFAFIAIFCLKKEAQTYDYTFPLQNFEVKNAALMPEGFIRSFGPDEDYNFSTPAFILPIGDYVLEITYAADTEGELLVQGNNDCVFNIHLSPTGGELQTITHAGLSLPNGTDRGRIKLFQPQEGQIDIYGITIHAGRHIYRDYYFIIAVAALIAVLLCIWLVNYEKFRISRAGLYYILAFLAIIILVNLPFLMKGLYFEIDTQAHLKRIEGIANGIRDRQLPVLVGPNYANQYGELVILNPDLFLYIPAFLRLLNVSIPTAYSFYMILVNVATAIAALVCAERLFGSVRWAIIASIIYLVEPFRLFVMLGLGAGAGMGTAMVFLPFVITGIIEVLNHEGMRWKYLAVGLWGAACSHVLSFALAALFVLIYTLFHFKSLKDRNVIGSVIKATVLFFVLSIGMLAPFLGYYFTDWNKVALAWTDFYHYPVEWAREVQNIIAVVTLITAFLGLRATGRFVRFEKELLISAALIIWMATRLFPWSLFGRVGLIDAFLEMMQYPLRFHLIASPMIAIVCAGAICSNLDSVTVMRHRLEAVVIAVLTLGTLVNFYQYYDQDRLFFDAQTGHINSIMEDYLPAGTLTEWYATDTGEFSDYDDVTAYYYTKRNTDIDLTYTSASEGQYMEFPLFYYDGYVAYDGNGQPLKLEQGTHNRVRVYLNRTDGIQELHVRFVVKQIYTLLFLFSVTATLLWFIWNIGYLGYRAISSKRVMKKPVRRLRIGMF